MTPNPGSEDDANADVRRRATDAFKDAYGVDAVVTVSAPGRVNLIGEHVDYNDGLVLPLALTRTTAVAASASTPGTAKDEFTSEAAGDPNLDPMWSRYPAGVLGVVREALADDGVSPGPVRLSFASDVPIGAGLSSSAALEVATARALLALSGAEYPAHRIAQLCQRAEHLAAGVPCGIMDLLTAAAARPGHAIMIDCRDNTVTDVGIPEAAAFVVVDSGARHALADGAYAARRSQCEEAARILGVRSLRDATVDGVASGLDGVLEQRARHVVTEIERTRRAADALAKENMGAFGVLMNESHRSLRDDFEVSTPALDSMTTRARTLAGVHGARMTGGGFGGCAVVLVDVARADDVARELGGWRAAHQLSE